MESNFRPEQPVQVPDTFVVERSDEARERAAKIADWAWSVGDGKTIYTRGGPTPEETAERKIIGAEFRDLFDGVMQNIDSNLTKRFRAELNRRDILRREILKFAFRVNRAIKRGPSSDNSLLDLGPEVKSALVDEFVERYADGYRVETRMSVQETPSFGSSQRTEEAFVRTEPAVWLHWAAARRFIAVPAVVVGTRAPNGDPDEPPFVELRLALAEPEERLFPVTDPTVIDRASWKRLQDDPGLVEEWVYGTGRAATINHDRDLEEAIRLALGSEIRTAPENELAE